MQDFLTETQVQDYDFISKIISENHTIKTLKSKFLDAYNSYAFELNEDFIIRFPRNERSLQKLVTESKVLSFLKGKTTLQVPQTEINDNKYLYTIHKKVVGDNINQKQLSELPKNKQDKFFKDIAKFIFELNSVTDEISNEVYLPIWDRMQRSAKPDEVLSYIVSEQGLNEAEKAFIVEFYKNFELENKNKIIKFSHFDIMAKNLAFDNSRQELVGIYDFGDCALGDVYHDFSQIGLNYNINSLNEIAKHYKNLSNIELDVIKIWNYSLHSWLVFHNKFRTPKTLEQLKEQIGFRVNL